MLFYYNVKSVWFDFKWVDEGCAGKSRRYLYNTCILVGRRLKSKIIKKKFVRNDNIDNISTSRYSYITTSRAHYYIIILCGSYHYRFDKIDCFTIIIVILIINNYNIISKSQTPRQWFVVCRAHVDTYRYYWYQ